MISLPLVNDTLKFPDEMSAHRRVDIQGDTDDGEDSSLLDSSDSVNLLGRSKPTFMPHDR